MCKMHYRQDVLQLQNHNLWFECSRGKISPQLTTATSIEMFSKLKIHLTTLVLFQLVQFVQCGRTVQQKAKQLSPSCAQILHKALNLIVLRCWLVTLVTPNVFSRFCCCCRLFWQIYMYFLVRLRWVERTRQEPPLEHNEENNSKVLLSSSRWMVTL